VAVSGYAPWPPLIHSDRACQRPQASVGEPANPFLNNIDDKLVVTGLLWQRHRDPPVRCAREHSERAY
jgi:hypothetical protein